MTSVPPTRSLNGDGVRFPPARALRLLTPGERQGPESPDRRPRIHTAMIAVDICAFGDPRRDDIAQLRLRREMYQQFARACASARLPWDQCYREDRGDGVMVITPSDVPIETLIDPLGGHLASVLHEYNRHASQTARLQLRLAVHTGLVNCDEYGVTGQALVHLFRLLEARDFKDVLAASGADLGVIVSERLYGDALSQGGLAAPEAYRRLQVDCKETRIHAHVRIPGPCGGGR
ncbi:hypothetical protein [Actinomadura monticuli]|uniref:Guanylate cyclase domain-containing protein n=1 Tax=Actinomadura monticuli TaxID=3097367 RepID=A0ABV4QD27_9ACTN